MDGEVSPGRTVLAARIRELVEAAVLVDDNTVDLGAAAAQIEAVTGVLRGSARDSPLLIAPLVGGGHVSGACGANQSIQGDRERRHRACEGSSVSVNNPVEGAGNPLAPPLVWRHVSAESVRAECAFTAVHEGPPGRVHGGWIAAVLDHAVGRAVAAAGFPGMTASLTVDYRAGAPYGEPLVVEGRFVERDGRKLHATAELRAGAQVTATAAAMLVLFRKKE